MIAFTPARRRWALIIGALALLAGIGLKACGSSDNGIRYRSEKADRGDIAQSVAANGQLSPVTLVSVGTQVSGIVRSYSADFNDRVEAGQVLMRLDDAILQAQLTQSRANQNSAEASLALARSNWARIQPLARDGFASSQEVDQSRQALREAEARVTQTRAQVQRDQVNLGYSVIRSPVSGVVVLRAVDVGQTVAASFQTPELYKIAKDLREMVIDAYFTESDIGDIRVGQAARFRVDAFPNRSFDGVVKQVRLNPKTEQNVVTYAVVVAVDNVDESLLPGMTAYVSINTQEKQNVLRVPTAALRFRPPEDAKLADVATSEKPADATRSKNRGARQSGKVWINGSDGLRAVPVKLGITDRRFTEIVGGALKVGDAVVIEQELSQEEIAKKGMKFRMND
ncbi:MAG: efflux RND transporter periplasmic adaptor subunit [Pseudomonadota bacterium]